MEEILHQLIGSLSHYLPGFIHLNWCRISSINSSKEKTPGSAFLCILHPGAGSGFFFGGKVSLKGPMMKKLKPHFHCRVNEPFFLSKNMEAPFSQEKPDGTHRSVD